MTNSTGPVTSMMTIPGTRWCTWTSPNRTFPNGPLPDRISRTTSLVSAKVPTKLQSIANWTTRLLLSCTCTVTATAIVFTAWWTTPAVPPPSSG